MPTILVSGSDTGIGKTRVTGVLAGLLSGGRARVQVVKVVESGCAEGQPGDAVVAARLAATRQLSGNLAQGCRIALPFGTRLAGPAGAVEPITLFSFAEALAPAAAARRAGAALSFDGVLAAVRGLGEAEWRIYEGAGGIASPIDEAGRDWADFAKAAAVDFVVVVVPDRLGAINQARLAAGRASQEGLTAGIWLNASQPVDRAVAQSNRQGIAAAGLEIWGELEFDASRVERAQLAPPFRWQADLAERDRLSLRRRVRVTSVPREALNLSDNDYLDLAHDPALAAAAAHASARWGTSASASPLITGWTEPHERLVQTLCGWHGFSCGLLWTSGYAANAAVLSTLPVAADHVFSDRLVHHSMIAGLLRSGATLRRYPHLDLDRLEQELARDACRGAQSFVVTESVFSMDGDYPDLGRLAELKQRHSFFWVLDEAHALGWYGVQGAGLADARGVAGSVDVLVGTLGKTLASGGAYTLFHSDTVRDFLVNHAGEFIYSTGIPPANAAVAEAAVARVRELAGGQAGWHERSRSFRAGLRADGWDAPDGESSIVPVRLNEEAAALSLAEFLKNEGIYASAVRPPTVPRGTSRIRFSLKRTLTDADLDRVRSVMRTWRSRQ